MHIQIKNATLKYMQMVDCKSGHSPLLTAIHKFKYNVIKWTIILYDIVDYKNELFKKADTLKSLIADLKEFNKVNNTLLNFVNIILHLILDGRWFQASTLLNKKDEIMY